MIPTRNLPHLMLRKDVVAEVRKGGFHIWAVESIEQGLEVLSGRPAVSRAKDGSYPDDSVIGRADEKLQRLAQQVRQFGPADVASHQ